MAVELNSANPTIIAQPRAALDPSQPTTNRPTAPAIRIPLSELRPGDGGAVSTAALSPGDRELLQALGLTEASQVRLCQSGNPCIVLVRNTRIGLAEKVAQQILVDRTASSQ